MTVIEATSPTVVAPERRRLMGKAYDLSGAIDASSARLLAGLDWEAEHKPLYVQDEVDIDNYFMLEKDRAVVRSDNAEVFGVVGREHKILTNAEMFDFADTLLTEADTTWADSEPFGGALAGGKKPFLAFQLGEGVQIAGKDAVGCAVLLSNGHVGNTAFTLNVTPIRLRCSNVVTATIHAGKAGKNLASYTIQHSGDLAEKMAHVKAALNVQAAYMREFEAIANRLADIDFGLGEFEDLLTELVPVDAAAGDRAKATAEDRRAEFRRNWRTTPTLDDDLRSTAWGALNVITEVIDHGNLDVRKSKVALQERRVNSIHFGEGARLRDRAYRLLGV